MIIITIHLGGVAAKVAELLLVLAALVENPIPELDTNRRLQQKASNHVINLLHRARDKLLNL
jgi:hypothetical protein